MIKIIIMVETEAEADTIEQVIEAAEQEEVIDFSFNFKTEDMDEDC